MDTVGARIKMLRKEENLKQIEFSKRLLISQSYLSGLENGNEVPTSKLIKLIGLEFGVNLNWLLEGKGEMYDAVYENDKSYLAEISNSALLTIMNLLNTKSNVKYGFYANSLERFAAILSDYTLFSKCGEDSVIAYLDAIQNFIMDLERMIFVSATAKSAELESHRAGVYKDLDKLLLLVEGMNKNAEIES